MPVLPSYRSQSIDLHSTNGFYMRATLALNGLKENSSYNLRSGVTVNKQYIRMKKFGFENVSKNGAIFWINLLAELKNAESLTIFKQKIKSYGAQVIAPVKHAEDS